MVYINFAYFWETQAKVMALFTKSRMLSFLARRGFATTVRKQEVHPAYLKIKETQKKFQVNNGLSVSHIYVADNL